MVSEVSSFKQRSMYKTDTLLPAVLLFVRRAAGVRIAGGWLGPASGVHDQKRRGRDGRTPRGVGGRWVGELQRGDFFVSFTCTFLFFVIVAYDSTVALTNLFRLRS